MFFIPYRPFGNPRKDEIQAVLAIAHVRALSSSMASHAVIAVWELWSPVWVKERIISQEDAKLQVLGYKLIGFLDYL